MSTTLRLYRRLQRPLDWLYIVFCAIHFIASILVDGQYFYPQALVPSFLFQLRQNYLKDSADPLLSRIGRPEVAWFTTAIVLELILQCPVFVLAIWALWRKDRRVYPLLAAYSALASSSTLFCLVQALCGPHSSLLSSANRIALVQAYGPFLAIPSVMLVDMLARSTMLVAEAVSNDTIKARKER